MEELGCLELKYGTHNSSRVRWLVESSHRSGEFELSIVKSSSWLQLRLLDDSRAVDL